MRTSERATGLLCAVLAAAVFVGCARSAASPPQPRSAPASPAPGRASGAAPASGQATQAPHGSDPSEEITPSELASIPDPVPQDRAPGPAPRAPDRQKGDLGSGDESPGNYTQGTRSSSSGLREPSLGDSETATEDSGVKPTGKYIWRVQIFASQDLSLADRKAKEAEERLGVKAHIEFETSVYKVRLGAYASEEGAQSLREKAIQAGFTGAFRVRCESDITQYKN